MASLINVDAPGAYPTTPSNEEPLQQTQHSGHGFTDSRVPMGESSLAHGADSISSRQTPVQSTQRNNGTPRSLGNGDTHFSGHHFKGSGIYVDNSSFSREGESEGNHEKPGLMTGAYSRVGSRDSSFARTTNYTYGDTSTTQPSRDKDLPPYDDAKSLNTPTNLFTPTNTPAEIQNPNSNFTNGTATNANEYADQDRNKVQGGLRGKSHTGHSEPYWGSIPFGVGVYNGVAGHGSNESTTHQKSFNDLDNTTAISSGVYNGVTSHGSESTARQSSVDNAYGDAYGSSTTNDASSQQRAFPLAKNADTIETHNADTRNKDSHFKEALTGAGATAAGGYTANKYLNRDSEKEEQIADKMFKDEKPQNAVQTKPHTVGGSRSHKGRKVAPVASLAEDQSLEQQATLGSEGENKGKEDSNLKYCGAATAAAGAGTYGMYKYASRDGATQQVPENEKAPPAASRDTIRDSAQNVPATADIYGLRKTADREERSSGSEGVSAQNEPVGVGIHGLRKHPKSSNANEQADRMPSGTTESQLERDSRSIPSYNDRYNDDVASGNSHAKRSSSDSSHGGQYNVLSSGTPSGINLEQAHISGGRH
ncbi:hypothetical protein F5X98DRAFT_381699 [Xylaria grammica]|nr:hypothetical protein F5X98DRAFT_381699 [Xylaria grammica]